MSHKIGRMLSNEFDGSPFMLATVFVLGPILVDREANMWCMSTQPLIPTKKGWVAVQDRGAREEHVACPSRLLMKEVCSSWHLM